MNHYSLPLFPLNLAVCPEGLVPLKIFEARYLDMVKNCLRNKTSFVITAVLPESETGVPDYFANVGTVVDIIDADVTTVGLMLIRCKGQHRVKIKSFSQQTDGLIVGEVSDIENDSPQTIPEDLNLASRVLQELITNLSTNEAELTNLPVIAPYRFDDAAWVANRWIELLNLPLVQKQRFMEIDSPVLRLELINDIIESGYPKTA